MQDVGRINWDIPNLIVISTFSHLQDQAGTLKVLENVDWLAIFLDEAHVIRNAETQSHIRLIKMKAFYRLCITGM